MVMRKILALLLMFLTISAAAALAAPTVTGVLPSTFPRTWIGTLTITGTGFTNGATAYVGDGISAALTGSSDMPTTFVSSTTLEVYIRASSGAIPGNHNLEVHNPDSTIGTLEAAFSVTVAPTDGPVVSDIYFDGVAYTSGQEITARPRISAKITDASGLSLATVDPKILVDNVVTYDNLASSISVESATVYHLYYYPSADMTAVGLKNIYINVKDTFGNPGEAQCLVDVQLAASTAEVRMTAPIVADQTVCAPTPANPVNFQYKLDGPARVRFRIFGSTPVLTRDVDGDSGVNHFSWDGSSDMGGGARNGYYKVQAVIGNRVVGDGFVVVLR
ncbi:IPT/TIG domain-containing protein [Candidatus Margulisiibacteriota bacterium]